MVNDPQIKTKSKCFFGKEGNAVTINHIQNDWYTFVMSDHYDQNSVSFYLHKDELGKLANFIKDSIRGDQSNV
jgi:hypothetical protein